MVILRTYVRKVTSWALVMLALLWSSWASAEVRTGEQTAKGQIQTSGEQTTKGQIRTVERTTKGQPEKDIQVGLYVNVQPDCSSGPLPSIRLVRPPAHGKITVKKASVNATNYKQCLALQVPGFVAFYHSMPGYIGTDTVTLEIKFPAGRTEVQVITVELVSTVPAKSI